jgi:SOS-response transcriptional repressor LexA
MTPRQREVLDAIRELTAARGAAPTLRELGARLGITSTNAVSDHLKYLQIQGLLTWEPGKSRTLRVLDGAGRLAQPPSTSCVSPATLDARGRLLRRRMAERTRKSEDMVTQRIAAWLDGVALIRFADNEESRAQWTQVLANEIRNGAWREDGSPP